ncbi:MULTISPECIES: hypothetical protein [Bacillus cereus group]|uniref:ORC-CDC6 family AAA ATPase n=1 Tax=Bacillus cereus group TaxID=86661 RepID=UPI00124E1B54|nr:hypothetical protein [Bacillus cereus]KAB2422118.1 hypothetical protein F8167_16905 [Bacillus cereus]
MRDSLGNYIVDRTESLNEELIKEYFIDSNDRKLARLLDAEQYLLLGSRGIGKTMLMKKAEIEATDSFEQNSILAVWISFEESIRIERIKISDSTIDVDPFLQWTMGKILIEVLKKIIELKPNNIDFLSNKLSKIFPNTKKDILPINYYTDILHSYLDLLETADIDNNTDLNQQAPSKELVRILDNPHSFKLFILEIISNFNLKRVILLFDEAAHVFSPSQQEKFFTFFKSLRSDKIACKAAVYPGITTYGKSFERNQDAKEIKMIWNPQNKNDLTFIRNVLKKRIQSFNADYWQKLSLQPDIIDTICMCSNGNPRFAFHIIDEMENNKIFTKKNITKNDLINSIRRVVNTKWDEFITLSNRLVKYKIIISEAENWFKNIIIPNLRNWNNNKRTQDKKLSSGFYLETSTYEKIIDVLDILSYSNFIYVDESKKSIGHNKYGYYISINPALLFSDSVLRDSTEMYNTTTNIDSNQNYSKGSEYIKPLLSMISSVSDENSCSNTKCDFVTDDLSFTFCKKCGSKMEIKESAPLYKILRSHEINCLKLSNAIITRLSTKFSNVGELYDASPHDISMPYIKDYRITKIKDAVKEYMAG